VGCILAGHGSNVLARREQKKIFAVALCLRPRYVRRGKSDEKLHKGNGAFSRRTRDINFGAKCEQGGGKVAGESRKAHTAALRRNVAYGAGCLQAVIVGVSPPFALIVENAPCVETEIATDGSHIAVCGTGDVRGGLRKDRVVLINSGVLGDFAQTY